jgi:hypothetical protein
MFRITFLVLLSFLILASWLSWGMLVLMTGPELLLSRVLFFILLFVAIFASGTLAAYSLGERYFVLKRDRGRMGLALLQGLPLGFFGAFSAWLQSLRLFTLVNALIMVTILGMLEYLLLPKESK